MPAGVTGQLGQATRMVTVPPEYARLIHQLSNLQAVSEERTALVEAALSVWSRPGFDTLAALSSSASNPLTTS